MQCLLCQSKKTSFLYTSFNKHGRHIIDRNDTFSVYQCQKCGCMFLGNIKINDTYYKKYYDTGYYDGGISNKQGLINGLIHKLESRSLIQKEQDILKYAPKRKGKLKILDIGCGSGKFLGALNDKTFEKYGIEINEEGLALSRKKGFTIYDKDLMKIDFKNKKFDIITLWHVLEHLVDPISTFKKIHSILEEDGMVLSATPNIDSLGCKLGKINWFHLDSPRHLILFNLKSNDYLCQQTGFKLIKSIHERYDFPLDLLWSVKYSPIKYIIWPTYPLAKFLDNEVLTVILKKNN